MKKGDKVRVKSYVPLDGRRTGVIVYQHVVFSSAWWVEFDDDHGKVAFFENDLELVECAPTDNTTTDLTGKRVRVTRGYWKGRFGNVVEPNGVWWNVDFERSHEVVSFAADQLEVVDDSGEPVTHRKSTRKKKARAFTPDELQSAYNGDSSPADNAIAFACDMWTLLLAEAEHAVTWNDGRLEVVR